jgi:hypothetical protein
MHHCIMTNSASVAATVLWHRPRMLIAPCCLLPTFYVSILPCRSYFGSPHAPCPSAATARCLPVWCHRVTDSAAVTPSRCNSWKDALTFCNVRNIDVQQCLNQTKLFRALAERVLSTQRIKLPIIRHDRRIL